jgi:hypothetical protein
MGYKKKKLDGRRREAKKIAQVQKLIASDLDCAAAEILRRDILSPTL